MPVTDQQIGALRALVLGGEQEFVPLAGRLTDADMPAYEFLLQAALALAATQHFTPGYSGGDLIKYVARIRAGTADRAEDMDLDPLATEATLRRALGQPAPSVMDPWTRLRSTVALLTVLFSDLDLDGSRIDALFTAARVLADQWLSQKRTTAVLARIHPATSAPRRLQ